MAEKKYYWLKLKNDFFAQPRIKKLRRMAGGDTYTIIYLKMQLLSLENEGVIIFEGIEDDFIEELALTIDEDSVNSRAASISIPSGEVLCETPTAITSSFRTRISPPSIWKGKDRS